MNLLELRVASGERTYPADWHAFATELRMAFEPTTLEETSRRQLRRLKQFGSVEDYVQQFLRLSFRVADLSQPERYSLFLEGLREPIRSQVAGMSFGDPDMAINMAQRLGSLRHGWDDSYRQRQSQHSGGRFQRSRGRTTHVAIIQQRGRGRGQPAGRFQRSSGRGNQRGNGRGRGPSRGDASGSDTCRLCGSKEHYVSRCPRLAEAARHLNG